MLGLPAHPGLTGAMFIALGLLTAAVLALPVWRALRHSLGEGGIERWAAAILAASLLSSLAAAPFLAWRIVQDIRYTSRLTHVQAERIGGDMQLIDHRIVDRLRAAIPPGQTFYITASPRISGARRYAFRNWIGYALLPRIRVLDPARANWIVGWERDPRRASRRTGTVARLQYDGGGVVYLARTES
jgi:hypothetical protein